MARKGVKIASDILNIYFHMRGALRSVNKDLRSSRMCLARDFFYRINRPQSVGNMVHRHDARLISQ